MLRAPQLELISDAGDRERLLAQPDVRRPRELLHGAQRRDDLGGVARGDHREPGLGPHQRQVLERVMGHAVVSVINSLADTDDPHREPVQYPTVADELVSAHRSEGGDRVCVRRESRLGQAGRHPHHVLLGHPGVEEAVGKPLDERLERGKAEIAGEQHDALVVGRQLDQCLYEFAPHAMLPDSCSSASVYSSSDIGR